MPTARSRQPTPQPHASPQPMSSLPPHPQSATSAPPTIRACKRVAVCVERLDKTHADTSKGQNTQYNLVAYYHKITMCALQITRLYIQLNHNKYSSLNVIPSHPSLALLPYHKV